MYPANLQNKIILNNTKLQTIENIKNERKKILQGNVMGKKNILQSIEKGKNFPAQQVARKKILAGPKSSPPPSPPQMVGP